jgi:cell wall-associated NlpC family hydrolase
VTTAGSTRPSDPDPALAAVDSDLALLVERRADRLEHATRSATRAQRVVRTWALPAPPGVTAEARGVPAVQKKRPRPAVAVEPRRTAERVSVRSAVSRPLRTARKAVKRAVRVTVGARAGAGRVLAYAYGQIGKPYVKGAAGPRSFDCSGLTQRAYRLAGVRLPHKAAGQRGRSVSARQARPGDLVKWGGYHVGIYAGAGMVIHAPKPGDHVKKSRLWGTYRFVRLL